MDTDNNTWGGPREGAGRPAADTLGVLLRLRKDTARQLARAVKQYPPGDRYGQKSRIADAAIRRHLLLPDLPPV